MNFRVFNDFKRRVLAGEVEDKFNCKAYLLNSAYANIMENNLYARTISDFTKIDHDALYLDSNANLRGNALEQCAMYQNTYYRMPDISEDDEETSMYTIVNSANISAYSAMLGIDGDFSASRFNSYLKQYSYFYLVSRADEFAKLVKECKENEYETFAVVLADDIEHIVIDSTCFGSDRTKPFRGTFDGNGYALHIAGINAKQRSNGVFGYIAEEGVVRNLIIKADELSNYANNAITIQNSETISLDTIKAGEGDVKIGVLAGVNEGTIENVLLSADITYVGNFTPEVYFVQNKCNSTKIVSDAWMQLPASLRKSLTNSTALSSFDNFFYPTQLCINSYANVIPYVGYFNEGSINNYNTNSAQLTSPMYKLPKEAYFTTNNKVFMPDIAKFNRARVSDKIENSLKKHYVDYNDWYFSHPGYDSDDDPSSIVSVTANTTFRMGPNNKQAYLLGSLLGLNNGDLTNVAVKSLTTFDTNFVALVGGLAGRGGRGVLSGVFVNAQFSATSAIYDHYITVQSDPITTAAEQNFHLPKTGTSLYKYTSPGSHSLNITFGRTGSSDLSGTSAVSNLLVAQTVDEDDILAAVSAEASYEGKVTQRDSFIMAYGRDTDPVTSIFEDPARADGSVRHLFTLEYTSAGKIDHDKIQLSAIFNNGRQDITAGCKICDVVIEDYYGLGRDNPSVNKLVPIVNTVMYEYADGKTMTIKPTITIHFSGTYGLADFDELKGYVKMPLEDIVFTDVSAVHEIASERRFTTSAYNSDFQIHLKPLYNIGGMFGEYVYSDAQSIDEAAVHVSAKDFHLTNGYMYANNLSYFAGNLTFDSSNKSNADTYSATEFYSDHARTRNLLRCSACAPRPGYIQSDPLNNCGDMCPTVEYIRYINMYNQIAPAIVSTQYTFNEHSKGRTEPPALGSMFTDFNFYQFGLNMGSNSNVASDPDGFGNWLITSANSGIYFNFPGQTNYYRRHEADQYTGDTRLWNINTILTAAYNITNDGLHNHGFDAYYSKQLTRAPQHYPMYRGRATLMNGDENFVTFDAPHYATTHFAAATGSVVDLNKRIENVVTRIESSRSETNDPIYIYSHSAREINSTIDHVSMTMYFTEFATAGQFENYTFDRDVADRWVSYTNSARCYALSSDSYTHAISEPKATEDRTYDDGTGVPLSANSLVFGFIPTSADVIRALNDAEDATLECTGIKSDNINYLLVVDNAHRPIFDVELDVTAADNDGYFIKFPQLWFDCGKIEDEESHSMGPRYIELTAHSKLGGLAINIENGNN